MEKKYSINMENDEIVSIEVDGVRYDSPDQIPDAEDRAKIEMLMSKSVENDFGADFDKEFEEEFRQLERDSKRFPIVIVGVFLTIAVIMLAIAVISGINTSRAHAREKSAPGQVVDLVVRKSQVSDQQESSEFYYPVVEFRLPNQSLQTVQLSEGSWPPAYGKGDPVTILYDPQQPHNARIQSTSSTILAWILPGITGTVGVAFLVAALFTGWFLKPEPSPEPPDNVAQ
jgi:hypothetical protein